MKKFWSALVLAITAVLMLPAAEEPPPVPEAGASIPVPTIAVLPFSSRGTRVQNEELGKSIAELISVELMSRGEFDLVERAELEKILTELQLSASGLIDPQSRLNLGRLTGARVLVAGSVFTSGDKNFIVDRKSVV